MCILNLCPGYYEAYNFNTIFKNTKNALRLTASEVYLLFRRIYWVDVVSLLIWVGPLVLFDKVVSRVTPVANTVNHLTPWNNRTYWTRFHNTVGHLTPGEQLLYDRMQEFCGSWYARRLPDIWKLGGLRRVENSNILLQATLSLDIISLVLALIIRSYIYGLEMLRMYLVIGMQMASLGTAVLLAINISHDDFCFMNTFSTISLQSWAIASVVIHFVLVKCLVIGVSVWYFKVERRKRLHWDLNKESIIEAFKDTLEDYQDKLLFLTMFPPIRKWESYYDCKHDLVADNLRHWLKRKPDVVHRKKAAVKRDGTASRAVFDYMFPGEDITKLKNEIIRLKEAAYGTKRRFRIEYQLFLARREAHNALKARQYLEEERGSLKELYPNLSAEDTPKRVPSKFLDVPSPRPSTSLRDNSANAKAARAKRQMSRRTNQRLKKKGENNTIANPTIARKSLEANTKANRSSITRQSYSEKKRNSIAHIGPLTVDTDVPTNEFRRPGTGLIGKVLNVTMDKSANRINEEKVEEGENGAPGDNLDGPRHGLWKFMSKAIKHKSEDGDEETEQMFAKMKQRQSRISRADIAATLAKKDEGSIWDTKKKKNQDGEEEEEEKPVQIMIEEIHDSALGKFFKKTQNSDYRNFWADFWPQNSAYRRKRYKWYFPWSAPRVWVVRKRRQQQAIKPTMDLQKQKAKNDKRKAEIEQQKKLGMNRLERLKFRQKKLRREKELERKKKVQKQQRKERARKSLLPPLYTSPFLSVIRRPMKVYPRKKAGIWKTVKCKTKAKFIPTRSISFVPDGQWMGIQKLVRKKELGPYPPLKKWMTLSRPLTQMLPVPRISNLRPQLSTLPSIILQEPELTVTESILLFQPPKLIPKIVVNEIDEDLVTILEPQKSASDTNIFLPSMDATDEAEMARIKEENEKRQIKFEKERKIMFEQRRRQMLFFMRKERKRFLAKQKRLHEDELDRILKKKNEIKLTGKRSNEMWKKFT